MNKDVIDMEKEWKNLKTWLGIKDDANNEVTKKPSCKPLPKITLILRSVRQLAKDWFTSENLSALLNKIRDCKIYLSAKDMNEILSFFNKHNSELKFNDVIKSIFEIVFVDNYDGVCCSYEFGEFVFLLDCIIEHIHDYDFALSDVLKNIGKCRTKDMTDLLCVWSKFANHREQPFWRRLT